MTLRSSLIMALELLRRRSNVELKSTALVTEAAGSRRSPAEFLMVRRGLPPARLRGHLASLIE